MELTINPLTLRGLLSPASAFASSDDMLPVLNAVHLRSQDGDLIATATDRFVVGMFREKGNWPEFEALIPLPAVRAIVRAFCAAKGSTTDLTLSVEGEVLYVTSTGGLGFDFADARIGYRLEVGTFPNVVRLIPGALAEPPRDGATSAFNPAFLARFAKVGSTLAWRIGSGRQPTVITDGERFVGAIMPRRMQAAESTADPGDYGIDFDKALAGVADIYAEPKPAPKKRASRKKAS